MKSPTRAAGWTRRSLCRVFMAATVAGVWMMPSSGDAAEPASSPATLATVEQPRAFGHTVGDVLTQRVLLQSGGHDVGSVAPPSVGRIDIWLERRPVRFETDSEGRRWMVIDYQIVNGAQTLTKIALPALSLTSASGATLQVAEWAASVGPLTAASAFGEGDLKPLRPDRLAPMLPTAPLRRQLGFALGLLIVTLLAWLGWWLWRTRRESARLPFARAWRQIQRLDAAHADSSPQAWFCVHRALNETAGHVVQPGSLANLFARAPYLQPLGTQLEHFYQHSSERFFTPAAGGDRSYPLHALCRALYRAEKRHQR